MPPKRKPSGAAASVIEPPPATATAVASAAPIALRCVWRRRARAENRVMSTSQSIARSRTTPGPALPRWMPRSARRRQSRCCGEAALDWADAVSSADLAVERAMLDAPVGMAVTEPKGRRAVEPSDAGRGAGATYRPPPRPGRGARGSRARLEARGFGVEDGGRDAEVAPAAATRAKKSRERNENDQRPASARHDVLPTATAASLGARARSRRLSRRAAAVPAPARRREDGGPREPQTPPSVQKRRRRVPRARRFARRRGREDRSV